MSFDRWSRSLIGAAIVGVTALGLGGTVSAQDATPVSGDDVVACTVDPIAVDEVIAVWFSPDGSPVPSLGTPEPVETAADLPQGMPADAETSAAVTATMKQVFACFDAGKVANALALMRDNAIGQFGPDVTNPDQDTADEVRALIEAQIDAASTPTSIEGLPMTVVSDASSAQLFDDGRPGAVFESEGDTVFAYFVQEGDTWLLDDIVDILDDSTPTAG